MQNALEDVKSKRTAFAVHIAPMRKRHASKDEVRPDMALRLERARIKRGYSTARAAAEAFGWKEATYVQHESGLRGLSRAAKQYANAFRVPVGWLVNAEGADPFRGSIPLVGFASAGSNAITFSEGQGPFDHLDAPEWANERTVAVEIRGDSLGDVFDGWIAFYDDRRQPPDPKIIGSLCIVGLADGRVLIKRVERGQLTNRYTLKSNTQPPIYDAEIEWAAPVREMKPRK